MRGAADGKNKNRKQWLFVQWAQQSLEGLSFYCMNALPEDKRSDLFSSVQETRAILVEKET